MTIEFNCSGCGDVFRVADEMAGRKGKCPGCGVINQIPHTENVAPDTGAKPSADIAPRPAALKPQSALVDDSEPLEVGIEDEVPLRSSKTRKKKRLWPVLLGVGFLGVLLASCGVGSYFLYAWYFGGGLNTEQKYFPNDTQLVFSVRVAQGTNSDLVKQFRNEFKPASKKDDPFDDTTAEKSYGIPMSNIDRMTFAAVLNDKERSRSQDKVIIIRTLKAVKGSDIKSNIEGRKFEATTLDNFTIYQSGSDLEDSFCVTEDKIVVYGHYNTLKRIVDRGKKPELPEAMEKALKNADFTKTVAFAVNVKDLLKADKPDRPGPSGKTPAQEMARTLAELLNKDDTKEKADQYEKLLDKVESLSGSADVKSDATLTATLICKDASAAEDIKKILDGGLATAKDKIKDIKEDADAPRESLTEAANNVTFAQNGNLITAKLVLKGDPLVKWVKKSMEKNAEARIQQEKALEEIKANQKKQIDKGPPVPQIPKGPGGGPPPKKGGP